MLLERNNDCEHRRREMDFPDAGYCLARLRMPTIDALLSSRSVEEVILPASVCIVSVTVCRAGVVAIANIAFYGT